jgi:hypothetical protein
MPHIRFDGQSHNISVNEFDEIQKRVVDALEKDEVLSLRIDSAGGYSSTLMISRGASITFNNWDSPVG